MCIKAETGGSRVNRMLFLTSQSERSTMNYTHLTREERYQIHALCRRGLSCADIARDLQRHRSSISRELKRNAAAQGYKPAQAHDKARARQCQRRNAREFCEDEWKHVSDYLRRSLSPEQAAGRLGVEKALHISAESIYQYVYEDKRLGGDLVSHLNDPPAPPA
jgi:IS30 family transposase